MKTIFITGASSGLGKAAAQLFTDKGWRVIATMRHPEKETDLALDITHPGQVKEVAEKAIAMGVDVVFNNAGYGLGGPLESYTSEQIGKQIDTNLVGVIRVIQAFVNGRTPTISSSPERIAEVVYEAATDGKDQLRYPAGEDAVQYVFQRAEKGAENFRRDLNQLFFHSKNE